MNTPIGVYAMSAFGGIEVLDIDSYVDLISYKYLNPDGSRSRLVRSKIRFNAKGEPYFIAARTRVYLSEVIRIGSPWIGMRKVA